MPRKPSIPSDRIPALSDLQRSGHTYKELAELEGTTPSTVQRHVERYRLNARAEAAEAEAQSAGFENNVLRSFVRSPHVLSASNCSTPIDASFWVDDDEKKSSE